MQDLVEYTAECLRNPALIAEYNRLKGTTLGVDNRTPMEMAIDHASEIQDADALYNDSDLNEFIRFVYRVLWLPMVAEKAS